MLLEKIYMREVPTLLKRNFERPRLARFLKGPIPLDQIAKASALPGQALGVFLAVHHRVALTRSWAVTLPKAILLQFGISRDSKARSLHQLERAGLVTVERNKGRAARITLLSPPAGVDEKVAGHDA